MVANYDYQDEHNNGHRIVERRAANPAASGAGFNTAPLQALNYAFIELLRREAQSEPRLSLPLSIARALPRLSNATLHVMAQCPFALFDLHDAARNELPESARDAQALDPTASRRQFANSALFYAWHALQSAPARARLQLGLGADTAQRLRAATVRDIAAYADAQAHAIAPRWPQHRYFWPRLLRYAESGEPELTTTFWLGRQLLAAEAACA